MSNKIKKENLSIAFIGAGKIASSFIPALLNAGYKVDFVLSKSLKSAKEISTKFNIKNFTADVSKIPSKCDLIILAVPDNQIKMLAQKLSKLKLKFDDVIIIHLSGSLTVNELKLLHKKGASTASFHIMQTFPDKESLDIMNSYCAIESTDKSTERFLFNLAADLNLKPFKILSEDKTFYHLMGVVTSNFQVSNFIIAENIRSLIKTNLPPTIDLVFPTAFRTLSNIRDKGIEGSLSGPIERGELDTIKRHLSKIKNHDMLSVSYILASLNLLEAANIKLSIEKESYTIIKKYLMKQLRKYSHRF